MLPLYTKRDGKKKIAAAGALLPRNHVSCRERALESYLDVVIVYHTICVSCSIHWATKIVYYSEAHYSGQLCRRIDSRTPLIYTEDATTSEGGVQVQGKSSVLGKPWPGAGRNTGQSDFASGRPILSVTACAYDGTTSAGKTKTGRPAKQTVSLQPVSPSSTRAMMPVSVFQELLGRRGPQPHGGPGPAMVLVYRRLSPVLVCIDRPPPARPNPFA